MKTLFPAANRMDYTEDEDSWEWIYRNFYFYIFGMDIISCIFSVDESSDWM